MRHYLLEGLVPGLRVVEEKLCARGLDLAFQPLEGGGAWVVDLGLLGLAEVGLGAREDKLVV